MSKTIAGSASCAVLLGLTVAIAVPTAAHAQAADATPVVLCESDGTYTVTWTYIQTDTPASSEGSQSDVKVISHAPSVSTLFATSNNNPGPQIFLNELVANQASNKSNQHRLGNWTQTFTQSGIPKTATTASVGIQTDWLVWSVETDRTVTLTCPPAPNPVPPPVVDPPTELTPTPEEPPTREEPPAPPAETPDAETREMTTPEAKTPDRNTFESVPSKPESAISAKHSPSPAAKKVLAPTVKLEEVQAVRETPSVSTPAAASDTDSPAVLADTGVDSTTPALATVSFIGVVGGLILLAFRPRHGRHRQSR